MTISTIFISLGLESLVGLELPFLFIILLAFSGSYILLNNDRYLAQVERKKKEAKYKVLNYC